MMSKSTFTYLSTVTALGVGLWCILKAGSRLQAPPDLEGSWELSSSVGLAPGTGVPFAARMEVEQSGRYFQITFDTGLRLDAKLLEITERPDSRTAAPIRMRLSAGEWSLIADGARGAEEFHFELSGPKQHEFTGRRPMLSQTDEGRPERH